MPLAPVLDRLLEYASRTQPGIRDRLQPGLDQAAIEQIVPFDLPDEVSELYAWANGTPGDEFAGGLDLFYYHRFLPLEEAYTIYQRLMQVNRDIGIEGYDPNLFPLFTFHGEHYAVWFGPPSEKQGTIYFVYQGDGQVYDDLASMLGAILECYDEGAYEVQGGDIVVNETLVAEIKARWNACRRQPDGTTLDYHP